MGVLIHQNWATPAFEYAPAAAGTGPFASRGTLTAWWRHHAEAASSLWLVESDSALLSLVHSGDEIRFVGDPRVIDYHSPLGRGAAELIAEFCSAVETPTTLLLDSMPLEAANTVSDGLAAAGVEAEPVEHDSTAVLRLSSSFDDWLDNLTKRHRHEIRRKRRRFESSVGPPRIERRSGPGAASDFVEMHRKSTGVKGGFMTEAMSGFFLSLEADVGAVVDFVYGDATKPLAAAFGFEDDDAYYLYNSAYEPDAAELSPGIILASVLIEQTIARGASVVDFLKGDEPYKVHLGARSRPLYVVEAKIGGAA